MEIHHVSAAYYLLPHIEIYAGGYRKLGTNNNLVHNTGSSKDVSHTDVVCIQLGFYSAVIKCRLFPVVARFYKFFLQNLL